VKALKKEMQALRLKHEEELEDFRHRYEAER
jgi:hypothetical protein